MPGESPRFRPLILLLALSLAVCLPASAYPAAATSVVHGNVYEWSTFGTLNNAEVTVNSVPQQVMVSKNGSYGFSLARGTYAIVARSSGNGSDVLLARENVTITQDEGNYVIDLILFPSSDPGDLEAFNDDFTPIPTDEPDDLLAASPAPQPLSWAPAVLLAIGALGLLAGAGAFLFFRKKKTPPAIATAEPEETVEPEEPKRPPLAPVESVDATLPDDLREVLRIIEKGGGRITQLDLRKGLPYSEAKVSLMVTDLESRGIVKKIKKGRGNVIILNRPGTSAETE